MRKKGRVAPSNAIVPKTVDRGERTGENYDGTIRQLDRLNVFGYKGTADLSDLAEQTKILLDKEFKNATSCRLDTDAIYAVLLENLSSKNDEVRELASDLLRHFHLDQTASIALKNFTELAKIKITQAGTTSKQALALQDRMTAKEQEEALNAVVTIMLEEIRDQTLFRKIIERIRAQLGGTNSKGTVYADGNDDNMGYGEVIG